METRTRRRDRALSRKGAADIALIAAQQEADDAQVDVTRADTDLIDAQNKLAAAEALAGSGAGVATGGGASSDPIAVAIAAMESLVNDPNPGERVPPQFAQAVLNMMEAVPLPAQTQIQQIPHVAQAQPVQAPPVQAEQSPHVAQAQPVQAPPDSPASPSSSQSVSNTAASGDIGDRNNEFKKATNPEEAKAARLETAAAARTSAKEATLTAKRV